MNFNKHELNEFNMATENDTLFFQNFSIGSLYTRMDVAHFGNVTPPKQPRDWSGIVRFNNCVLLFVTLDKKGFESDIQYH